MIEGERGSVEESASDFKAIIEHSDGSQNFIVVGSEDLIINEEGRVVGIIYSASRGGDILVDILYKNGELSFSNKDK